MLDVIKGMIEQEGVSTAELSRRTKIPEYTLRRMFRGEVKISIEQLTDILKAMGFSYVFFKDGHSG